MGKRVSGMIAVTGQPNAGKSTLFNQIMGKKLAIISPKPQTTRFRLGGIHTTDQGQMVLFDLPGFFAQRGDARNSLRTMMDKRTWTALDGVDLLWYIIDSTTARWAKKHSGLAWKPEGRVGDLLVKFHQKGQLIVLMNKIDLINKRHLLPLMADVAEWFGQDSPPIIPISALNETQDSGLSRVLDESWSRLKEGENLFPEDRITDRDQTFFISEFVREQIFNSLEDEIPYGTTVEVEKWEPETTRWGGKRLNVWAKINVLRKSHKAILIGKGGQSLKQIGMTARINLGKLLGLECNLFLHVAVKTRWNQNMNYLEEQERSLSECSSIQIRG